MEYKTACRRYSNEVEELGFLKDRLKTAPPDEVERIQKNIESRNVAIALLKKWFRFTKNKLPETT